MNSSPRLTVGFLDVAEGDSIVIVLPDGKRAVVVDTPHADITLDFLRQHRVEALEYVIVSHLDADHAEGIIELVDQFPGRVRHVIFNIDRALPPQGAAHRRWRARLREMAEMHKQGVELSQLTVPDLPSLDLDGVVVRLLHPTYADLVNAVASQCQNEASGVLVVEYNACRILLAADIGPWGWERILERQTELRADILKFPHHGAQLGLSDLTRVLDRIDPMYVVLCVGTSNPYNHPDRRVLEILRRRSGLRILCTEATTNCDPKPSLVRDAALRERHLNSFPAISRRLTTCCPCAGSVVAVVNYDGLAVSPGTCEHSAIIDLFQTPRCRNAD